MHSVDSDKLQISKEDTAVEVFKPGNLHFRSCFKHRTSLGLVGMHYLEGVTTELPLILNLFAQSRGYFKSNKFSTTTVFNKIKTS